MSDPSLSPSALELVGERDKAVEQVEMLLKIPWFLSPGWLRVDPTWDELRENPRFRVLLAGDGAAGR